MIRFFAVSNGILYAMMQVLPDDGRIIEADTGIEGATAIPTYWWETPEGPRFWPQPAEGVDVIESPNWALEMSAQTRRREAQRARFDERRGRR